MIKANELRIGNLIKVGKNIAKVNGSLLDYCDSGTEVPEFYPIPITLEILEKAGFAEEDGIYSKGILNIGRKRDGIFGQSRFELISSEYSPDLEYVHQLQNLIFSLTGEELEINL